MHWALRLYLITVVVSNDRMAASRPVVRRIKGVHRSFPEVDAFAVEASAGGELLLLLSLMLLLPIFSLSMML